MKYSTVGRMNKVLSASNPLGGIRRIVKTLHINPRIKIVRGQRHTTLVSLADSILFNHLGKQPEERLHRFLEEINKTLCDPEPLPNSELHNIWRSALNFVSKLKEQESEQFESNQTANEDDDLNGIDNDILQKLSSYFYSIVSSNPPVMYVAHKGKRKIIKAVIKFVTEITSGNDIQEQKIIKQFC